jgi:hypothetical protein
VILIAWHAIVFINRKASPIEILAYRKQLGKELSDQSSAYVVRETARGGVRSGASGRHCMEKNKRSSHVRLNEWSERAPRLIHYSLAAWWSIIYEASRARFGFAICTPQLQGGKSIDGGIFLRLLLRKRNIILFVPAPTKAMLKLYGASMIAHTQESNSMELLVERKTLSHSVIE